MTGTPTTPSHEQCLPFEAALRTMRVPGATYPGTYISLYSLLGVDMEALVLRPMPQWGFKTPFLIEPGQTTGSIIGRLKEAAALPELMAVDMLWRHGRRNHRIIYAQAGPVADDNDQMIGSMDTVELARRVVADHNMRLYSGR